MVVVKRIFFRFCFSSFSEESQENDNTCASPKEEDKAVENILIEMWIKTLLIFTVTSFIISFTSIYFYFKYKYRYWAKEKIPFLEPEFPYGNTKSLALVTASLGPCLQKIYEQVKNKSNLLGFGGFYVVLKPSIMLVDPEMIKNVLTKDFAHFHDRGLFVDEDVDPLGAHLVTLKGLKWKNSRAKMTPTFTSGKMKMMFQTMLSTTAQLTSIIDKHVEEGQSFDTKDIFARLATDIIGSVAFGLDCNSLKDPNVEFRKFGQKVFAIDFREAVINIITNSFPKLLKIFRVTQRPPDVTNFFMSVLKDTIVYREKNNIQRNDFMNLWIRLKNKQSILDDDETLLTKDCKKIIDDITFNEIAANAFLFFTAGFETTSSTLSFCLFELVKNLDIQNNARMEVLTTLRKHEGKLSYNGIMEMKYMDRVFCEVLRKYPSVPLMLRKCNKDYKLPNNDYIIKKDVDIVVSLLGLHNDPEYFPEPEKFDPERFTEEEKAKRHPYSYLPFGEGPRICIGQRFALLQMKTVLALLLRDYRFFLDPKTVEPIVYNPTSIFLASKNTFWVKATKLNN